MSSALEVAEYSYDTDKDILDDSEALEVYKREKILHPDALVVLEQLECGLHWHVDVYESSEEKTEYLQKRIKRIFRQFAAKFKR